MLWKLAGFLAHSPYAECCSCMSDAETYVRTHDETDLAKNFLKFKGGGKCGITEGILPAVNTVWEE